jgi:hypothetical protein
MSQKTGKRSFFGSCLEALMGAAIFIMIGLGLSYWGWTIVQDARASSQWPATEGTVTSSEVRDTSDAESDSYSPKVTYEYQVDEVRYENDTISFGQNAYGSRRKAEGIAAGYPAGSHVTVYYEPGDPSNAVLEPGADAGSFIVLAIGALFTLIGLIVPVAMTIFKRS